MKKIFISYTKQDEEFRMHLEKHLSGLKRSGLIETWQDQMIKPSEEWNDKIKEEIDEADICIILTSPDYLASNHIWENELKVIFKRAKDSDDNIILLPIIIRPCDWIITPLAHFNALDLSNTINEDERFLILSTKLKDLLLQNVSRNSTKGLALAKKLIRENLKSKEIFLDLGNCGLVDLSELPELWNCTHLEKLDFSTKYDEDGNNISDNKMAKNRISIIPEGIEKLNKLKELNLSENYIGNEGIILLSQKLKKLQSLDISYSSINDESLMQICNNIPTLKILNLDGNDISDHGFQYIPNHLNYLESLSLSHNNSIALNIEIYSNKLTRLKKLVLSHCNVSDSGVNNLKNLRNIVFLDLTWNQITISGILGLVNLTRLKELYLENNLLNDAGAKYIGKNFRHLQILNLSKNEISDDGANIIGAYLINLQKLNLSKNNITEVGAISIAKNLINLKYLDVSDNKIGNSGADAIGKYLKELEYLDLMTNTLSDEGVKSCVINLPNLTYADFSDNYMIQIPHSILDNIETLRNWFSSKRVPNNTIKMILLGNTRAGKSELAHILKEDKNKQDDERTHGMEHWLWEEKISNDQTLRTNIYDFGGQDYYHATHHLFFTHNTLYVVLWHNEKNEDYIGEEGQHFDPGFWLGNIKYLLQDKFEESQINATTAIWLVQNKGDLFEGNPRMIPDSKLCNTYKVDPNGIFYLSLLKFKDQKSGWKNEWAYFRKHLINKLTTLAGDIEITEMWEKIRDGVLPSLQKRNYLIIDHDFFFEECNVFLGVKQGSLDDYRASLTYLNGCGEIIIFDEIESLKDKVILNPKRLMKIMYAILTKQAAPNEEGLIELSEARQFQESEYISSEMYYWIIDILTFYNIIFRHPIHKDKYVAPQYLKKSSYQNIFNDLIPASLIVKYNDFIPMAVMGRFISHYLKEDQEAKYWKYGAIFNRESCYCMVRMDRETKKVYIHVDERKTQSLNASTTKSTTQAKDKKNNLLREFMEFFTLMTKSNKISTKDEPEQNKIYIQGLELSINDKDFFSVETMLKDLDHCQGYLPNKDGNYQQVPAIFYFLLHKQSKAPKTIFICYSHADVEHRDELDKHLAALKLQGKVDTFHDGKLLPGQKWDEVIKTNLYKSDIVILLLSVDFMNSRYIWETELKIAKEENKTIVPVFLRHCDIEGTDIDPLQGAPYFNDKTNPKNFPWILGNNFKSIDEAYLKVVERIKSIL